MKTTNVRPSDLNYHNKPVGYDREIVIAIPFHAEIQGLTTDTAHEYFGDGDGVKVLDLGCGSGLTSEAIRVLLPKAHFTVVDFSSNMLDLARQKLGEKGVEYVCADYSEWVPTDNYDLVISVISLHHQTDTGKELVIKKIHQILRPGGIFLLGDLITHKDPKEKAFNNALHFHHMVENCPDEETLVDWAHHHQYLNQTATVGQHLSWMEDAGFSKQEVLFSKFNTALMLAVK